LGALAVSLLAGCAGETTSPPPGAPASRPYLNVMMRSVEFPPSAASGGATAGVQIDLVPPGGASEEAGIREGDIVLSSGGRAVTTGEALADTVQANGTGKPITWVFLRDGQRREASLMPRLRGASADRIRDDHINARIAEEESLGDSLAAAGQRVTAFSHYVRALQLLYYSPPRSDTESRGNSLLTRMVLVRPPELRVPDEARRHRNRAIAMAQAADHERARAAFVDALYHAPWLPELWHNAGLASERAGDTESARRYLRRALMLNPEGSDSESIRQRLATLGPARR